MAYTITNQNQNFFSKIKPLLTYLLLFLVLGGIAYAVTVGMQQIPGMKQKGALSVSTKTHNSVVYLDGEEFGETPIEKKELNIGDYDIEIRAKENSDLVYSSKIEINPGVETTLQRDLGVSDLFSSGMNFWMRSEETALTIISQPSGATIFLDGTEMGKTPITIDKVTEGNYTLRISSPGYEGQSVPIQIKEGYKLTASAQLFPIPIPSKIEKFEGSQNLYDLTISNTVLATSARRAKAIVYWAETRGLETEEDPDIIFDYFIDSAGNVYDSRGDLVTTQEGFDALKQATTGGYLGKGELGQGLSEAAKETYLNLFGTTQTGKILPTGFGWLRVRETPSLTAAEVTKVDVGETFPILEIQGNWVKIELTNGTSGWVSGTYVEIQ